MFHVFANCGFIIFGYWSNNVPKREFEALIYQYPKISKYSRSYYDFKINSSSVDDVTSTHSVQCRIYVASSNDSSTTINSSVNSKNDSETCKNSLIVYFHGGGFVMPLHYSYHKLAQSLASPVKSGGGGGGGHHVLVVDYSLSPESKFPTAVMESFSVLRWISEQQNIVFKQKQQQNFQEEEDNTDKGKNEMSLTLRLTRKDGDKISGDNNNDNDNDITIKYNKLIVMGDSAGGNLAAVCSKMIFDAGIPLKISLQILIYPAFWIGVTHLVHRDKSHAMEEDPYVLSRFLLDYCSYAYFGDLSIKDKFDDPRINPMFSKNGLKGTPPTLLITADRDCLTEDGLIYAKAILDFGNIPFRHLHVNDTVHGFLLLSWFPGAKEALKVILKTIDDNDFQSGKSLV